MKKIIGILGVAAIAATMFFSANNMAGSSSDVSLASLVGMNSANAEEDGTPKKKWWENLLWKQITTQVTITKSTGGSVGISVIGEVSWEGTTETYVTEKDVCVDGNSLCSISHWF